MELQEARKCQRKAREHDLLSFLSVIVHEYSKLELDFTLLSVVLDEIALNMRPAATEGSYFSVAVADGKSLLEWLLWKSGFGTKEHNFPPLVAIKTPIIKGALNSSRNRRIWTSMAIELQILRNAHLSNHSNVVSLLDVCWQSVDDETQTLMPALVLEAASMDLDAFMLPAKAITRRKVLGLAIDITSGVRAIHDAGIVHCDIKPRNVLIFEDKALGFTAKIADFGSALLLSSIQGEVQPPGGTGFYQAPECSGPLSAQGLVRADMYSLGLIIWNLLSWNLAMTSLQSIDN